MARQRLVYKTYPVSTRVDPRGVYYGIVQGATTEPETSLREILAYKKVTAFDPAQVVRLVEDVIQGGMELTALDGRPRAISSMIKTYLGFDSSFPTADARVTSQSLVARVRLLKDLRIPVNMDDYTLVNDAEVQLPYNITSAVDMRYSGSSVNYLYNQATVLYTPISGSGVEDSLNGWLLQITGRRLDEYEHYQIFDKTDNAWVARRYLEPMGNYNLAEDWAVKPYLGFYQGAVFFQAASASALDTTHEIVLQACTDSSYSQTAFELPLVVRS